MLEKLAKQTAVYGISTIVVRFLCYLLTPYYTRVFGQETYGVVTDIYALIPLALTLLTMGMMQLPPAMISLPFKILLFVMVDGWNLIVSSLVPTFA